MLWREEPEGLSFRLKVEIFELLYCCFSCFLVGMVETEDVVFFFILETGGGEEDNL